MCLASAFLLVSERELWLWHSRLCKWCLWDAGCEYRHLLRISILFIGNCRCLDKPVHKAFAFSFHVIIYIHINIVLEYAITKAKKNRWLAKEKCPHHLISCIQHPSTLLLYLPSMILCLFLAKASLIPPPLTVFLHPVSLLW